MDFHESLDFVVWVGALAYCADDGEVPGSCCDDLRQPLQIDAAANH